MVTHFLCPPLFTAIPYCITITTGLERDAGTTSRAYVIIMGAYKIHTSRMWLELPEGKNGFVPGSVEKFQIKGLDVGDIKKIEVSSDNDRPPTVF